MSRYPYPVLTSQDSSYKDEIVFEITYIKSSYTTDKISFEFDVKMNSEYIKSLIESEKAKMYIKMQSNIYACISELDIIEGNCCVEVRTEKIQINDNLNFNALIVATEELELAYHEEMLEIYRNDYSPIVSKQSVLAVSNKESLSYNASNNEFIKFSVADEMSGNGYKIEIKHNYINVVIGPEFNKAYAFIKNNKKEVCSVFDSHLIFEVFVYVLIEIVQEYESYCEEDWYILFEQMFLQCSNYKDMESFIVDVKDENRIDISQIFEQAQRIVNNQIEGSIIMISRTEEM